VFIVALDQENKIYLVKLFRYPTQEFSWEVPGGGADGEEPIVAAERELREEAGLRAGKMEVLGKFNILNGVADAQDITVLATDLEELPGNLQEEEGIVAVKKVSFKEAFEMIKNGDITDGETIAAVTFAAIHLGLVHP
jgi:8-oxo-dGTP pyrophosphatase MutT (NUDIX family)